MKSHALFLRYRPEKLHLIMNRKTNFCTFVWYYIVYLTRKESLTILRNSNEWSRKHKSDIKWEWSAQMFEPTTEAAKPVSATSWCNQQLLSFPDTDSADYGIKAMCRRSLGVLDDWWCLGGMLFVFLHRRQRTAVFTRVITLGNNINR